MALLLPLYQVLKAPLARDLFPIARHVKAVARRPAKRISAKVPIFVGFLGLRVP